MSGCERSGRCGPGWQLGGLFLLLAWAPLAARSESPCLPAQTTQLIRPAPLEPPPVEADVPGGYGPVQPPSEAIDPPVPVVNVRVRVAPEAARGRPLEYHLTVENRSRAAAHHVLLSNPLPKHVRFVRASPEPTTREPVLRWDFGTLAGGARKEVLLVVEPTGDGDVQSTARVQFEHGETVRTRIARPALQVRKFGPTQLYLYDQAAFRLEVTNTGRADAEAVVVKDLLPKELESVGDIKPSATGTNPLTWKLGTIKPGQSRRIEFQVLAHEAGKFKTRVEAEAAGGLRKEITHTVFVGEAKLTIHKSGPARRAINRPTTYQITVANPGTLPTTNVQVIDDLHYDEKLRNGIEFVSASDGGQLMGREVKWVLGTLPPGTRRTVQVTVQARTPGQFVNVVTASADRGLKEKGQAPTRFEEARGVILEIDRDRGQLEVGHEGTFTVRVMNRGKTPVRGVGLVVSLPREMSVTDARGATPPADQDGGQVKFAPLTALAPGATADYRVTVKAHRPGNVRLRAEVTDPASSTPSAWEEPTSIVPPPLPGPKPPPAPDR